MGLFTQKIVLPIKKQLHSLCGSEAVFEADQICYAAAFFVDGSFQTIVMAKPIMMMTVPK